MFVVIVGDMDRDSNDDRNDVLSLLDSLPSQYSEPIIISAACKEGIGRFVRDRCIENKQNPDFGFVEFDVSPWVRLSAAKLAQVYMSRNASLLEIGEVFHIFPSGKKQGFVTDLINRVQKAKLPLTVHLIGKQPVKSNTLATGGNQAKTNDSMLSKNVKSELK